MRYLPLDGFAGNRPFAIIGSFPRLACLANGWGFGHRLDLGGGSADYGNGTGAEILRNTGSLRAGR